MEIKANLSQSLVEVEAELGKKSIIPAILIFNAALFVSNATLMPHKLL